MKIEFTECNLPLNKESLETLKEKGRFFLVKARRTWHTHDHHTWKTVEESEVTITTLRFCCNDIIMYCHDFVQVSAGRGNETIIGYCPLEFGMEGIDRVFL